MEDILCSLFVKFKHLICENTKSGATKAPDQKTLDKKDKTTILNWCC